VVAGASTTLISGGALALLSQQSEAISVDADFNIPDKEYENTDAVSGLRLVVDGEFSLSGDVQPDSVITRLEATVTDEFTQLAAEKYENPDRDTSHDIQFEGNLLDVDNLSVSDVNPTNIGETLSETITARLTVQATRDGHDVGTKELTDDFGVSVEKTAGSVTVSMGATGDVKVLE
jgi:hypothetical protein